MQICFWLPILFLIISLPSIIIYLTLLILSKTLLKTLTFKKLGYLKYKDINFYVDNNYFFLRIHIDYFRIYLIWLRLRINPIGVKVSFNLKNKLSSLLKSNKLNKKNSDSFIIQRNKNNSEKKNGILFEIKEKFFKIIKEKYINVHLNNEQKKNFFQEEEYIDNLIKETEISQKDKILRNILVFFDFLLQEFEINFKLNENEFFHNLSFKKGVFGVVKGLNKHKEIHIMMLIYNLRVKEYINVKNIKTMNKYFKEKKDLNNNNDIENEELKNPFNIKNESFNNYVEFDIINMQKIFVNFKLEYGFYPISNLSMNNTINIKIEIEHTFINISSRAIDSIMKLINEIIKFNIYNDLKKNENGNEINISNEILESKEIKFRIECVEEILLNMISEEIKKIKVKLTDLNINLLSDNHNYSFTSMKISNIQFLKNNSFNYFYDNTKLKLLNSQSEIKLNDLIITSSKQNKIILEIDNYSIILNSEVIYYHEMREAQIITKIENLLPNSNIIISNKELDKYFEIIFNVLSSIDKIESYNYINFFESKYREEPYEQNIINMNFDNINIIIYDEIIQSELNNLSIKLKIDERKNKGTIINIDFTPIYFNFFKKNITLYSSNCIINGLKLSIIDDLESSNINIKFDESLILIYDDILMEIMKFISSFLTFSIKYNVSKNNSNIDIEKDDKKKKKEIIFIEFPKLKIFYYVDFNDLFTIKLNDFKYIVDENISLPKLLIYHQNLTNVFIKKKTLFLNLIKNNIRFNPKNNEINIEIGQINLNLYCFELVYPIFSIVNYYQFFPDWIDFHMNNKYKSDEDYKLIIIDDLEKKDKCTIILNEINININQTLISNCAIFQTNPETLNNFSNKTYSYLDDIKCEQIKIKIKGFYLENEGLYQKELNKDFNINDDDSSSSNELKLYLNEDNNKVICQKNSSYYNKITNFQNNTISFNLIEIDFENINVLNFEKLELQIENTEINDRFNINQLNSISLIYKIYSIFYKKIQSRTTKYENINIYLKNTKIFLNDIKIIDKISLLTYDLLKKIDKISFKENEINIFGNEETIQKYEKLKLNIHNIQAIINCLDPKTEELYNKIYLNINCFGLNYENENDLNKIQLSIYYLSFGFNFSKNNDYPLLILPIAEININDDIIKINIPNNCIRKLKNIDKSIIVNNYVGNNKLDMFILNTQSFTIFINFPYLETLMKIIENFYHRCELIQKCIIDYNINNQKDINKHESLFSNNTNLNLFDDNIIFNTESNKTIKSLNNKNINLNTQEIIKTKILNENNQESNVKKQKIIIAIFDFKLIYLINYKETYDSTFAFHKEIKERGYFGYIVRLYSTSIKYIINKINENHQFEELNAIINLFTISCLNENNLIDEKFFKYDKDINNEKFMNLKTLKTFSEFMEIPEENQLKYLLINNIFNNLKEEQIFEYFYNDYSLFEDNFEELKFDFNNTLFKIYNINLKRDSSQEDNSEELNIFLNDMKITWNKLNMDMVNILVFEDILNIIDNILLKIYPTEEEKEEKDKISEKTFDLGRFNFIFEINDFQVCIENELTFSKVLLATRSKCTFGIKKLCMNEKSKNFKMELIIKDLLLFIPPFNNQHIIYFIGDSNYNKYYLDITSFNQMVNIPNITLAIKEQINKVNNTMNENNNIDILTNINIIIDKLSGDFSKEYFESFMNIIKVFIFNRGDTYAEEKISIDSRNEDLIKFKIKEIKDRLIESMKIKVTKIKIKQISFSLDEVIMTLIKEKKDNIKLEMRKFEGDHIIYSDSSSETLINVFTLNIFDLLNSKNKIILCSLNSKNKFLNSRQSNNSVENRIEMLRFRSKDSNISIGTASKWYVLDYLEIGVQPLYINISKYQCDFILEFFFNTNSNDAEINEDDLKRKVIENEKLNNNNNNNSNEEIEYPIYFKQVKVNETKLNISYFFNEGSKWNLKEAKIKFSEFEKKNKFYPYNTLIYRFIHHLKIIGIQNVGNVLASFLFTFDDTKQEKSKEKKKEEDDENYKKLLFGNLNSDK